MFCENCGQQMPDGSKFCGSCGATVAATPPRPSPQAPRPQPNYAPPAPSPAAQQAAYAQPVTPGYSQQSKGGQEPLSVGQYLVMFLLLCVPLLNLVLLIMWAVGSGVNLNKKNFARAALVVTGVGMLFWIISWKSIIGLMSGGY